MEARHKVKETSWKVLPLAKPEAGGGGEGSRDHGDAENKKFKNKWGGTGEYRALHKNTSQ